MTDTQRFTINDYVWVDLTEQGWRIFADYHEALGLKVAPYRSALDDGSGWQRLQMWDLMQIFGPHTSLGMPPAFMEMRFTKPDTEPAQ